MKWFVHLRVNTYLFFRFHGIGYRILTGASEEKSSYDGSMGNLKHQRAICLYLDCFQNCSSDGFSRNTWNLSENAKHECNYHFSTTDRAFHALKKLREVFWRGRKSQTSINEVWNQLHLLLDKPKILTWYGWYWLRSWYLRKEKESLLVSEWKWN